MTTKINDVNICYSKNMIFFSRKYKFVSKYNSKNKTEDKVFIIYKHVLGNKFYRVLAQNCIDPLGVFGKMQIYYCNIPYAIFLIDIII